MRLAVFGETSRTKHCLVKRALDAGYSVNVLERAQPVIRKRKNLSVIIGNLQDKTSLNCAIHNADAVLFMLHNPSQAHDDSTLAVVSGLVSCMEGNAVRRLVLFSCAQEASADNTPASSSMLHRLLSLFTERYDRPTDIEGLLQRTDIDWTIVSHPPTATTLHDDIAETERDPEQFRKELARHMVGQITDAAHLRRTLMLPV